MPGLALERWDIQLHYLHLFLQHTGLSVVTNAPLQRTAEQQVTFSDLLLRVTNGYSNKVSL